MAENIPEWIVTAHLLRPQGRKGEMLAELLTDFPERFKEQRRVFLAAPGFQGGPAEAREAEVIAFWLPVGKNQGRIVLHFAGVDSISDAESLAGLEVIVPREERQALDEDSVYVSELIGCTVYNVDTEVGVVQDVQFATTPDGSRRLEDVAPLLSVKSPDDDEVLIPFAKAFLLAVDTETRRIVMRLPEGLIEVNRAAPRDKTTDSPSAGNAPKR